MAALLGRRVLPRSAYRLIHNSVCLNNPDAKLRDLEIKDLSTVTIMKDPQSADLAIDEKASVELQSFLIDQVILTNTIYAIQFEHAHSTQMPVIIAEEDQ